MNKYKVLGNLKYNGTVYEVGSVIEVETSGEFDALVEAGVLVLDDGSVIPEATPEEKAEVVAPTNTWGPKPDEPVVEATPEVVVPEVNKDVNADVTTEAKVEDVTPAPTVEVDAPKIDDSNL